MTPEQAGDDLLKKVSDSLGKAYDSGYNMGVDACIHIIKSTMHPGIDMPENIFHKLTETLAKLKKTTNENR